MLTLWYYHCKQTSIFLKSSSLKHYAVSTAHTNKSTSYMPYDSYVIYSKLECGQMPNVMVALLNTGGALCSTPQSLADAHCWSAVQKRCQDAKPVEICRGVTN